MRRAPLGAMLEYWMRPDAKRLHIHRIEVEHALYLANVNQEQVKDVLSEMLRRNTASLESIAVSIDELRDAVAAGFSGVMQGLSTVNDTLHQGFYQLHLDFLGTHSRLDDILFCLVDKEGFKRELEARRVRAETQRARLEASGIYADAITLTQRALCDPDGGKAGAMLDEAISLFARASSHQEFALEAHFQLGYLIQMYRHDLDLAYGHYESALGSPHSAHFVRTARHLAHLDYLRKDNPRALQRMSEMISNDNEITALAVRLATVNEKPWPDCIRALETALEEYSGLLSRCARLAVVRRQFTDDRRFSATERFKDSYALIMAELHALQPDPRVYFDGARYAINAGQRSLAMPWIKHCYGVQPTLSAKRVFLLEAMADKDLQHA